MALWTFVLAEPGGGGLEIMPLDLASNKSYDEDLLEGNTASFTLPSFSSEALAISVGAHDVKIYRDLELRDRQRIVGAHRTGGDNSEREFTCVSYKQMLERKKLQVSDAATTIGYTGIDMEELGWNLINIAQSRYSGAGVHSYGITRKNTPTGRKVTGIKVFEPATSVAAALNDISQTESTAGADDAWEWDIIAQGDDLVYYAWFPRRGKDVDEANYVLDNHASVIEFEETFDFSGFANYIVCQGNAGQNQIHRIDFGNPTSGVTHFILKGVTTDPILWSTPREDIQTMLEAIPGIGSGNVVVTGAATPHDGSMYIQFTGALGFRNVSNIQIGTDTLSPTHATVGSTRQGSRFTHQVWAPDYDKSPYGVVEYYHFDERLTDMISVRERANYLLKVMSGYKPDISLGVESDEYVGRSSFGVGDFVIVDLFDQGYNIHRTDLRVSHISFAISDDGDETIALTVQTPTPLDRTDTNLALRVAAAEKLKAAAARKAFLKRVAQAQLYALNKLLAGTIKYYKTNGNNKIDKGLEQNKITAIQKKIAAKKLELKRLG